MYDMPDEKFVAPIEAVETVLEERGFDIDESGDDFVITFGIPNQNGGSTTAEAEFFPETNQLGISAVFSYGRVRKPLVPGLLMLLNSFGMLMPGIKFILEQGVHEEVDDELRISVVSFVVTDVEGIETLTRLGLEYLEETIRSIVPAILSFVSQNIKVRVDKYGIQRITHYSVPFEDCLAMAEIGTFGRA